jgi:hypothetical protein
VRNGETGAILKELASGLAQLQILDPRLSTQSFGVCSLTHYFIGFYILTMLQSNLEENLMEQATAPHHVTTRHALW